MPCGAIDSPNLRCEIESSRLFCLRKEYCVHFTHCRGRHVVYPARLFVKVTSPPCYRPPPPFFSLFSRPVSPLCAALFLLSAAACPRICLTRDFQKARQWITLAESSSVTGARALPSFIMFVSWPVDTTIFDVMYRVLQDPQGRCNWVRYHGICWFCGQGTLQPVGVSSCDFASQSPAATLPFITNQPSHSCSPFIDHLPRSPRAPPLFLRPFQMFFEPIKNAIAGIPS